MSNSHMSAGTFHRHFCFPMIIFSDTLVCNFRSTWSRRGLQIFRLNISYSLVGVCCIHKTLLFLITWLFSSLYCFAPGSSCRGRWWWCWIGGFTCTLGQCPILSVVPIFFQPLERRGLKVNSSQVFVVFCTEKPVATTCGIMWWW